MQKLVRKISPATVVPELLQRLDIPNAPKEVMLYDIYGITNKVRQAKPEAERQWVQFKGQFEAITEAGEIYASGACFLQPPFDDMLYTQLLQSQEADPKASVQFAVRVSLVPPKRSPSITGYEFQCVPLVNAEDTSPVAALRAQVEEKRKLLSAPKPENEATPPASKEPHKGKK